MPDATNAYEQQLLANVEKYGWHCTSVGAAEGRPTFTYTVGLYRSYGHPELLVYGLRAQTAHSMLSRVAAAASSAQAMDLNRPTAELVKGYDCVFVPVPAEAYAPHVLSALWFYEGAGFPLYQIVWPSEDGLLPWHPDADEAFRAAQPVLKGG